MIAVKSFLLTGPGYSMKQKNYFFFTSWINFLNINKFKNAKSFITIIFYWLSQVTLIYSTAEVLLVFVLNF